MRTTRRLATAKRLPNSTSVTPMDLQWTGCGFGLRISAPYELETLSACSSGAELKPVAWAPSTAELAWPGTAERLLDYRYTDGSQMLSVDSSADGSYLIGSQDHGVHVVSAAGDRITS